MMIYVRPLTVTLLCMIAAFGQIPALLHIGSCAHHCDHSVVDVSLSCDHSIKPRGCFHAKCSLKLPSKPASTDEEHSTDTAPTERAPTEHDSEHCIVCQSLLSESLVERFDLEVMSQPICGKFISIGESRFHSQSSVSIAAPRGPPSSV